MRALLPVCAGIAVVSGIVSFNLWRELRDERQRSANLQTQLDDARIASRFALGAQPAAGAAPAATSSTATAATTRPDAAPAPKPIPANIVTSATEFATMERDLMKDPEYRKLRLAQLRSNIARNYPGLAEELGLSDREADKLFDLLAENQLAMTGETALLTANGSPPDQAAVQQIIQRQQASQREQEAAIRSQLGDAKYAQWQSYQQTRPARQRVMTMNTQLAQAGMPLTDSQSRALTTAMIAEQQRQQQDTQSFARAMGNGNPSDPNFRAQLQEELRKRSEENNRRMIDAAAPHVNAKQLAALKDQFEQQAAMSRISSRMQIERDRLQQQQAQPAAQ